MLLPVLKRFVTVIFIFAFALVARAQQTHFIYLQTENGQPFYVKINNKVVSSSPAGYLILPKLTDGDVKLSIGFPKKEFPEENFQIVIDQKNEGFLLKNFGEKGWGLFNMQSYKVLMGGNSNAITTSSKNLQDDPFSKLLANVVKDSSILQKNEPLNKIPLPARADSTVAQANSTAATIDSTVVAGPLPLSPATRFLNKRNKDGLEMIYIDRNQNQNDTIRIFIPTLNSTGKTGIVDTGVVQKTKSSIPASEDTTSTAVEQRISQMKPDTVRFVFPEIKNVAEAKDSVISKKVEEVKQPEVTSQDSGIRTKNKIDSTKKDDIVVLPRVVQSSTTNSDCKAFATNEDFLKLRKKMASGNSDDNMIKIAKKAFNSKCFSTEQIKNLSFLFLTNEGKYMFFDMGYPFASDAGQYDTLQSQLTDSYYINRFKAMIHK